jgi:hypothetical protein
VCATKKKSDQGVWLSSTDALVQIEEHTATGTNTDTKIDKDKDKDTHTHTHIDADTGTDTEQATHRAMPSDIQW